MATFEFLYIRKCRGRPHYFVGIKKVSNNLPLDFIINWLVLFSILVSVIMYSCRMMCYMIQNGTNSYAQRNVPKKVHRGRYVLIIMHTFPYTHTCINTQKFKDKFKDPASRKKESMLCVCVCQCVRANHCPCLADGWVPGGTFGAHTITACVYMYVCVFASVCLQTKVLHSYFT